MGPRDTIFLVWLQFTGLVVHAVAQNGAMISTEGLSFTLAFFPDNSDPQAYLDNYLYMSSASPGHCTVSFYDGTRQSTVVHLQPGIIVQQNITDLTQVSNIGVGVEPKAIYVKCNVSIALHGFNKQDGYGLEPFLVLPDSLLWKKYLVASVDQTAFIGVVALQSDTYVSLYLRSTCSYVYNQRTYKTGDIITEVLQHGDVFRLGGTVYSIDGCDLGGTRITSNNRISVFSGSLSYSYIGPLCMHVPPMTLFSDTFIVPRAEYEILKMIYVRMIASEDNTLINITSEDHNYDIVHHNTTLMNKSDYIERGYWPYETVIIHSSAPIMVTQRSQYIDYGGSLILIPGVNQYGNNNLVKKFNPEVKSFLNITMVTLTNATQNIKINEDPILPITWTKLLAIPYSVGSIQLDDRTTFYQSISNKGSYNFSSSSPLFVRADQFIGYFKSFGYIPGFMIDSNKISNHSVSPQPFVHVTLYKDSDFRHQVQGSMIRDGDDVYVQVTSEKKNDVMVVTSCNAQSNDDPNVSFPLITNRCAVDPKTRILVTRYGMTRLKFKLNSPAVGSGGVSITCFVLFCDVLDVSEKCQQRCIGSSHGNIVG